MKPLRSETIPVRGRRYQVRIWGQADAPTLFFLHGWGDVGASFQFVVDALPDRWRVIAPDWRGFGGSQWNDGAYWFLDYLADLDALLAHFSPQRPVAIVGHSLGGIVASLYAGVRPDRVARFANLEGFALWVAGPDETPARLGKWLQAVSKDDAAFRHYARREDFAARLRHDNPRLTAARAAILAEHGLRAIDGGFDSGFIFAADPHHRWVSPVLFPLPDAIACWRQTTACTLWVAGRQSPVMRRFADRPDEYRERMACFADVRDAQLDDCGHMLHHDQPEALARL
ncbi:MAG: alpha/beta hydrolase, partial [Propionivibrio sp.]